MAGFNLPPGVTTSMIPGNEPGGEGCPVCFYEVGACICPVCPKCGAQGDIGCYERTEQGGCGLKLTGPQIIQRQEAKVEKARDELHAEEGFLAWLRRDGNADRADDPMGEV